jgi:hypothetical protein
VPAEESRLAPETPRFPIMSAGGKNVDGCGQIRVVARRFGWHQRGLGHDVGARGPTSTPQRLLRATKPVDLQLLLDGETRTRTGDTTIFRESQYDLLDHERPANHYCSRSHESVAMPSVSLGSGRVWDFAGRLEVPID